MAQAEVTHYKYIACYILVLIFNCLPGQSLFIILYNVSLHIETHAIIILSTALYGCVTWLITLGYGYIGARTDTKQQTNICLDKLYRKLWLHLNRQPFFVHYNDTRILCALQQVSGQTVGSKQTHFVGARQSGEITFQSHRFQCSR
jgi:hypothetical protein